MADRNFDRKVSRRISRGLSGRAIIRDLRASGNTVSEKRVYDLLRREREPSLGRPSQLQIENARALGGTDKTTREVLRSQGFRFRDSAYREKRTPLIPTDRVGRTAYMYHGMIYIFTTEGSPVEEFPFQFGAEYLYSAGEIEDAVNEIYEAIRETYWINYRLVTVLSSWEITSIEKLA